MNIKLDPGAFVPTKGTDRSVGYDLAVLSYEIKETLWAPILIIKTGVYLDMSTTHGFQTCGLVFPRSSAGMRGLVLANTVGVVDTDYQGEIEIRCSSWPKTPDGTVDLQVGERVDQIVFLPIISPNFIAVNEFTKTGRGSSGWGSTGRGAD